MTVWPFTTKSICLVIVNYQRPRHKPCETIQTKKLPTLSIYIIIKIQFAKKLTDINKFQPLTYMLPILDTYIQNAAGFNIRVSTAFFSQLGTVG